ncbi:MAG TPA: heterodisulfide reductase-related iron-sulfur binding cluster [Streptosporangiaceae bacterium]|nr:heterodisulfide reductase-related iron-sulfur binding cluster [Streptosporangiaceae bacterium]
MTADDTGIVEPIAHDDPVASALDPDGSLRDLAGDCVHCGFCLPACPTYQLWGEEMDSPRGRIHLITQILDSGQGSAAAAEHFDRCLGCMACVTACPSGVQYDQLIEAARSWAEPGQGREQVSAHAQPVTPLPARSRRDRAVRAAIFATFPYPSRLRAALMPLRAAQRTGLDQIAVRSKLLRRAVPEAAAALAVAPPSPRRGGRGGGVSARSRHEKVLSSAAPRLPARVPAKGERRAVVGMLTGCVQQVLFPQVNAATARVLSAEGCDVIVPQRQGCCGALSLHGGRRDEAADFARKTIAVFERAGVDAVIVNAAGCGSAMKEYGHLLAGDPDWAERAAAFSARVRDFSEFLAGLGPVAVRSELPVRAAYHDACHLGHAQRITAQPRALLRGVPGLVLAEIADAGTCCGSAGIYNLVQPEAAAELGERKARAVAATGADLLVSANPGCTLQIAQALAATGNRPMPVAHIAEVLDASIRGRPAESLLDS